MQLAKNDIFTLKQKYKQFNEMNGQTGLFSPFTDRAVNIIWLIQSHTEK